ncbi:MAG: bacillithiol biosynthesis cysteine-adding enzyme BshC [Bacteroidia bacterium]|nr:bacillithiol biosynthesis cysteine-adding enzyme BshC [Bacteroidia bacterium]
MTPTVSYLPFDKTGHAGRLVVDYLNGNPKLAGLHHGLPSYQSLNEAVERRQLHPVKRQILADTLAEQYAKAGINTPELQAQIQRLKQENTFTVTTGQQTGIFLGPAYTFIKILNTIKLSEQLNAHCPDNHYIPVFWMATEDHDFEEIRHYSFLGKSYTWETNQQGPVGRFSTRGISALARQMRTEAHREPALQALFDLFEASYSDTDLATATRKVVHQLFGHYGLLILDADDHRLKSSFAGIMAKDISEGNSFRLVSKQAEKLKENYSVQVNGRPVNFFWMGQGARTRIEGDGNQWHTHEPNRKWTIETLKEELSNTPEHFSPNVVMRPLYQEFILPNIAYIGGGAEVAYWLELKEVFDFYQVPYPILLMRNSFTLIDRTNSYRIENYLGGLEELFSPVDTLIRKVFERKFNIKEGQNNRLELLAAFFKTLQAEISPADTPTQASLAAMHRRWEHELNRYNQKIVRNQKKQEQQLLDGIKSLHGMVYPSGILQERTCGLADLFSINGGNLIPAVHQAIQPLEPSMVIARM